MISLDCLLRPHGQHYHEFGEEHREKDSTMILFIKDMNYELHKLIIAEKTGHKSGPQTKDATLNDESLI